MFFLGLEFRKCSDRFRLVFILCNIPILLVGLSAIGVGIWQVVLDNVIEVVFSEVNGKIIGGLFIGSGGGLAIISIFGVVGACFKSRFTLLTYSVILFLAIGSEVAASGYSFREADDIGEEQIVNNLIRALSLYYPGNSISHDKDINDVVDFIQENLECCGVNDINDWSIYSPYYMELDRLPASCCGREEPAGCSEAEAFSDTCGEPFFDFVVQNLRNIAIIGIVFAVLEVTVLVQGFVLFIMVCRSY